VEACKHPLVLTWTDRDRMQVEPGDAAPILAQHAGVAELLAGASIVPGGDEQRVVVAFVDVVRRGEGGLDAAYQLPRPAEREAADRLDRRISLRVMSPAAMSVRRSYSGSC
jgi:hypothetical protein